ncbi:hypothetical protein CSH63_23915 [Micromonospora tulbaghiae]|uniref:Uncharacterized protein n=1 Tax=Micromonospora tulbaghiae TaxID=479978 RepID=A0A386WS26_9ACTN|nr:hypothetical protein [Micromonospora tulbaghiae]AYF30438.1 hypothetical protein CSH63_23915 [Micromonospora tulbaghiae]
MSSEDSTARRVRFYGAADLATHWQAGRAAEIAERFDPADPPMSAADIIELHNVQQYVEAGFFPTGYTNAQRAQAQARIPAMRSVIARFFAAIDDANAGELVAAVDYDFHADLLELLGRNKAFERCNAEGMLSALNATGVNLGVMLANKRLVQAYDTQLRDALMSDVRNAEHVVRKYMQKDTTNEVHLPRSFSPVDARELLQGYVESADANPNYVGLIETAPVNSQTGVDAKLKLRAKRRKDRMTEEFFRDNAGVETGCEVGISDTQDDPVRVEMDGMVATFTYSRSWLDQTVDNPSILNNFQHLFEFADRYVLLTLPAYPADLGVFERFLTTTGKTDYHVGASFRAIDMSSLLQTRLYHHYLTSKGIDLEAVIAWFFEEYLVEEFGALNFSFTPSGSGSSYLQKARHLFAEMESVAMQFSLYAENGELDRDLLAVTSDPVRYKQLPSMLVGKYVYADGGEEIAGVLHVLFSDQSGLTYISDALNAQSAAQLLIQNEVSYADFAEHQRSTVDRLITLGVLKDSGTRVQIASREQFLVLRSLFRTQTASYYHLSNQGRAEVDSMVARGWVTRRASLLSAAEGSYFNYYLNKVEFTNGPELRNKYLHGSQANADGEDAHFRTYLTALRLIVALVIKINDDFCLSAAEGTPLDEK